MRRMTPLRVFHAIRWRVRNAWMLARLKRGRPGLTIGRGVRIPGRLVIHGSGRVTIGDECEFAGEAGAPNVLIVSSAGSSSHIGGGCRFNGAHLQSAGSIRIGNACLIADCRLIDTDFHPVAAAERRAGIVPPPRPIVVGDEVWICSRAAILKGVTIGDRAVIGYRAVVRRDVPADAVVIGNPAQVVKTLTPRPGDSVRDGSR